MVAGFGLSTFSYIYGMVQAGNLKKETCCVVEKCHVFEFKDAYDSDDITVLRNLPGGERLMGQICVPKSSIAPRTSFVNGWKQFNCSLRLTALATAMTTCRDHVAAFRQSRNMSAAIDPNNLQARADIERKCEKQDEIDSFVLFVTLAYVMNVLSELASLSIWWPEIFEKYLSCCCCKCFSCVARSSVGSIILGLILSILGIVFSMIGTTATLGYAVTADSTTLLCEGYPIQSMMLYTGAHVLQLVRTLMPIGSGIGGLTSVLMWVYTCPYPIESDGMYLTTSPAPQDQHHNPAKESDPPYP